jgi:hypothetical protein
MKAINFLILLFTLPFISLSQDNIRVEPPFWWTGMEQDTLQLMIYAPSVAFSSPRLVHPGVSLQKVYKTENPDYLFLDLLIEDSAKPGSFDITFDRDEDTRFSYTYELKEREEGSAGREGFGRGDVIYLLMPDRFSNGNPANDDMPGMLEKADRANPDGRHGGDITGIVNHLDYIEDMGFTAIWLNPVLENNNSRYSYHGYAITDFYQVDPRFGSNKEYRALVDHAHEKGIKVIKDMVFNHCGEGHWWMENCHLKTGFIPGPSSPDPISEPL